MKKRVLTMLLAFVMTLGLAFPAFAANAPETPASLEQEVPAAASMTMPAGADDDGVAPIAGIPNMPETKEGDVYLVGNADQLTAIFTYANADVGNTIKAKLNADNISSAITMANGSVTLDLNGKTLTSSGAENAVFTVTGGTLTLNDPSNGGTITGNKAKSNGGTITGAAGVVVQGGAVNVTGGTIKGTGTGGITGSIPAGAIVVNKTGASAGTVQIGAGAAIRGADDGKVLVYAENGAANSTTDTSSIFTIADGTKFDHSITNLKITGYQVFVNDKSGPLNYSFYNNKPNTEAEDALREYPHSSITNLSNSTDVKTVYQVSWISEDIDTKAIDNVKVEIAGVETDLHPARAFNGETVTVTITPKEGYSVHGEVTLTPETEGTEVTVTENKDGVVKFTMPKSDVTIGAQFDTSIVSDVVATVHGVGYEGGIWDEGTGYKTLQEAVDAVGSYEFITIETLEDLEPAYVTSGGSKIFYVGAIGVEFTPEPMATHHRRRPLCRRAP